MLLMNVSPNYINTTYYEKNLIINSLSFTLSYLEGEQNLQMNNTKGLSGEAIPTIGSMEKLEILSRIYLSFPIGNCQGCFTSKEYKDQIKVKPTTGWAYECQEEAFVLYPKETISLKPKETVLFQLDHIITTLIEYGMSYVFIKYVGIGSEIFSQYVPLFRKIPPLKINSFFLEQSEIYGFGDMATLSWDITGAESAMIIPGDIAVSSVGSLQVPIVDNTEFVLNAWATETLAIASVTVYMEDAEIIDFKASSSQIYYGDKVSLSFKLKNAHHCYISDTVGLATTSPVVVQPTQYSNKYVLSCENQSGLIEKSCVTIIVMDALRVGQIVFTRMKRDDTSFNYTGDWDVINAQSIKVSTSDGIVRCEDVSINHMEFTSTQTDPLTIYLECKGVKGQSWKGECKCNNF